MGRPKAQIDWKRVDQMLMAQCDGASIADTLGIHPDTLYKACEHEHKIGFSAYSQQKRAKGVSHAREVFYKQAWIDKGIEGQTTKQIFWLKNHAGMADKVEVKQQTTVQTVLELPSNGTAPGSDDITPPPRPTDSIPPVKS